MPRRPAPAARCSARTASTCTARCGIGVLAQDRAARRRADAAGALRGERTKMLDHLGPVGGDQDLRARLQEQLDAGPASVIRQAPAPAASNTRVGGEKP